jgi:urease accessory protein
MYLRGQAAYPPNRAGIPLGSPPTTLPSHWSGQLELWFEAQGGKTQLVRRRHIGPLVVQRPFHPEPDGTCHVYLLHPPGGVADGDELDTKIYVGAAARVLLTTPGAAKFYKSEHRGGDQCLLIDIGKNSICEYLPQETILFNGATARISTRITLSENATYVGWDFICFGRPAAGEKFTNGRFTQMTEVVVGEKPVWVERLNISGGSALLHARYGLSDQPIMGTMLYVGHMRDDLAERIRNSINADGDVSWSVSQLENVIVCRYLGPKVSLGKELFSRVWDVLRTTCQSKSAVRPRIWAT